MTTVLATCEGDRIYYNAPPTYKDLLTRIPGLRYDTKRKVFHAPLSWATCLASRGVLGEALEISPDLDAWGHDYLSWRASVERAKQEWGPSGGLRHYQGAGIRFLVSAERALLADDMRLGKSVQSIRALADAFTYPALIICPASVKWEWARAFETWNPGARVVVVSGSKAQREKLLSAPNRASAYIVSWGSIIKHSRLAPYGSVSLTDAEKKEGALNSIPWQAVIMDEAHRMKDPKAKQTRAAWFLAHRARYRWALTGTPLTDTPADLWAVMHALAPEEYPTNTGFIERYCDSWINWQGFLEVRGLKKETRDEFFSFFDARFLRRSQAEVLDQLPPTRSTREVEMGAGQEKAYRSLAKHMLAELDTGILVAPDPLVLMTRLLQTAAATPVLDAEGGVSALKMPSCKVDALLEIVDEAAGAPLVVFAESRKLIELCAAELGRKGIEYGLVTGAVSDADRKCAVDLFQDGKLPVLLLTFGAGAEGLDLSAATTTVFLQRSFSLVKNLQAADRTLNITKGDHRQIIDVVTRGTKESRVHELAAEKGDRLQEVCRDPGVLRELLLSV